MEQNITRAVIIWQHGNHHFCDKSLDNLITGSGSTDNLPLTYQGVPCGIVSRLLF